MINLFYNHYKTEDTVRQSEIDFCLKMNKLVFDKVIVVEGRPTFSELFAMTKDYPEDINVFCNADIYFPSTHLLRNIKKDECWALSRWDKKKGKAVLFDRRDSQDSWVFNGQVNVVADFTQGMWGADNRLAHEIQKAGYRITNPSHSIQTIHVHSSTYRDHVRTPINTVPPPYLVLPTCKLI